LKSRGEWGWQIYEGGIVDMNARGIVHLLPTEYIDIEESLEVKYLEFAGEGIGKLIERLEGKNIISINSDARWLLKIVDREEDDI
jgi:hypothetical protein